jgi:hypothetical protein
MKRILVLSVLVVSGFATGCNVEGVPVELSKACNAENDKKTIEVAGILEDKRGVFCSNTSGRMECGYKLVEKAGDEKGLSADIEVGSGSNAAEKPERGFKKEDLKIRDNEGDLIPLGDGVRLTGKLTTAPNEAQPEHSVCYLQVYKIVKQ